MVQDGRKAENHTRCAYIRLLHMLRLQRNKIALSRPSAADKNPGQLKTKQNKNARSTTHACRQTRANNIRRSHPHAHTQDLHACRQARAHTQHTETPPPRAHCTQTSWQARRCVVKIRDKARPHGKPKPTLGKESPPKTINKIKKNWVISVD